jgi:hypothetical protein
MRTATCERKPWMKTGGHQGRPQGSPRSPTNIRELGATLVVARHAHRASLVGRQALMARQGWAGHFLRAPIFGRSFSSARGSSALTNSSQTALVIHFAREFHPWRARTTSCGNPDVENKAILLDESVGGAGLSRRLRGGDEDRRHVDSGQT